MTTRLSLACLCSVALLACGGTRPPAPTPTLTYAAPEARSATYRMADTATVTVDGGAGAAFGLSLRADGVLDVAMKPGLADTTRVTVRFREFGGTMSTPMAGTVSTSEDEIRGTLVFNLDPRGRSRIVERPDLGGQAGQFLDPGALARELFPRFPPGRAEVGERWTDSLTYTAGGGDTRTRATVVRNYTLAEDTATGGRELLRITYRGTARYDVEGTRMGMQMRQELEGPVDGELLWDPRRRILVRSRNEKELTGSMEISGVGVPSMGLRLEGATTVRLDGS